METLPTTEAIDHFILIDDALENISLRGEYLGDVVYSRILLEDENELSEKDEYSEPEKSIKKQKVEKSFKTRLSEALNGLYDYKPFSFGGSFVPRQNELHLAFNTKKKGQWIRAGNLMNLDINALIDNCEPAPFGDLHTQQTILDPSRSSRFREEE